MVEDPTTRFSRRVDNYLRYRPGYPREVVRLLDRGSVVADIGSGTGLLSLPFLEAGYQVIGVEPNREMREAGDAALGNFENFYSVNGRAEATTLQDHSVDLIVAGQAFHWFDVTPTKREWLRILRPGGTIALIWNGRLHEGAFMQEVEEVIGRFAEDRDSDGAIREAGKSRIAGFFAPAAFHTAEFPNEQQFDWNGLRGRVFSASYLPAEGEAGADEMAEALKDVFDRHQRNGQVSFLYRTKVYWTDTIGQLFDAPDTIGAGA